MPQGGVMLSIGGRGYYEYLENLYSNLLFIFFVRFVSFFHLFFWKFYD